MIELQTELEGKRTYYRDMAKHSKKLGYCLGECWDYHKGCLDGELDRPNAYIQFETPCVIKHVVNTGLDKNANALGAATGFSQFQEPLDQDGLIRDKNEWEELGEQAVNNIMEYVRFA
ncbi:hypothetical protein GCM10007063_03980 [Lentibacillus kapialis]|uniref:Uncharacterized protein n=1 Tax=Lentibacillus kapialis TaxID=340214 RepID=A0A917PMP2_9BACI|nr:YugN family protein [Lentibacillus kapialis]GGJ84686.1 hypothetical protein GCM10007063_03980 [Lentibacillus kapialis]